ncbi:MAG: hypothetical protein ACYDCK_04255 [Thermoplasmatota archaeon]
MTAVEDFTYESLVNRWRKETRSDAIGKLDPAFYERFEQHLRALADEVQRENALNAMSPKATILQDELRNLRRARDDIYDARERKIVIASLIAARGGNPDRSALTRGEVELYDELVRTLKEARRTLARRADSAPATSAPPLADVVAEKGAPGAPPEPVANRIASPAAPAARAQRDPAPTVPEPPLPGLAPAAAASAEPDRRDARVYVQVLAAVPPFVASDLRTYALAADDLVALPPEAAALLTERGLARRIELAAAR